MTVEDRVGNLEQFCLMLSEAVNALLDGQSLLLNMSPAAGNPSVDLLQSTIAKAQAEIEALRGILALQSAFPFANLPVSGE